VSARELAIHVLLILGVATELVCCAGIVVKRDVFDRLHYAGASSTVPAFLILAAILLRWSVSSGGLSAIVAVGLLFLLNPMLQHATARVAYARLRGGLEAVTERQEPSTE
jgi:monovalent cation/proton antiporter MnhG/PhaG subunit